MGNGFGHAVVAEDPIHVVINWSGERLNLNHHIETNALCDPTFRLKSSNLDIDDVITQ